MEWKTKIRYCVKRSFITEEFYGTTLPDVELVMFDVSDPINPRKLSGIVIPQEDDFWYLEFNRMITDFYYWTLRQVEELKTKRDYQLVLDSCTFVDSKNFTFRLPVIITSLIGEFCNPVLSGGHILLLFCWDAQTSI